MNPCAAAAATGPDFYKLRIYPVSGFIRSELTGSEKTAAGTIG